MAPLDDRPAVELLASVVLLARRDAERGDAEALAWLADLQTARPRSLRFAGSQETPPTRLLREGGRPRKLVKT